MCYKEGALYTLVRNSMRMEKCLMKRGKVIGLTINFIVISVLIITVVVMKVKMDSVSFDKSAALAITEMEKGLREFEELIMTESSDLTYYKNIAKGYSLGFGYHTYTVDRYVGKYDPFYLEDYSESRDDIRGAVFAFTKIESQEELTASREAFLTEYEEFKGIVETLQEMEGLK